MPVTILTLGYEKKNIQGFTDQLKEAKVTLVLDVRERAWSHKRDFCKSRFEKYLSKHGISYVHIPEAGNPKAIRKKYVSNGTRLKKYEQYLVKTESGMKEISQIITDSNTKQGVICLTCFEGDHTACHRSVITDHLQKTIKSLQVRHL